MTYHHHHDQVPSLFTPSVIAGVHTFHLWFVFWCRGVPSGLELCRPDDIPPAPSAKLGSGCPPSSSCRGTFASNSSSTGAAAFSERGDSACGRVRNGTEQQRLQGSDFKENTRSETQAWPRRRFLTTGNCEPSCHTVEAAAVQTTACTQSAADYEDDAQLFELRRVAHRAQAECAEARAAKKKAVQASSAAEDRCKDAYRKAEDLQIQVSRPMLHSFGTKCPQMLSNTK